MQGKASKSWLKTALRSRGFELHRHDPVGTYAKRRQLLLEASSISTVLDVGAHAGEFGQSMRHGGYDRRIISFEPQAPMFERLRNVAAADPLWECHNQAVGVSAGSTTLHVSGNDGFSSSLRPMASVHEEAEPSSPYVRSETVEVVALDDVVDKPHQPGDLMLKVDTQGYEKEVLSGAESTLKHCQLVELELALVELYEGQALFNELVELMEDFGFLLTDIESGFRDLRTFQLLQIDGLFIRRDTA